MIDKHKPYELLRGGGGKALLIISGALTAGICLVMNLRFIPAIKIAAGGLDCFDMCFAYGADYVKRLLAAITDEGRQIYMTRQLPLDFIYPLCYLCFFAGLTVLLRKKADLFLLTPIMLTIYDYAENICILSLLRSGVVPSAAAYFVGIFTSVKTVLMYLVFAQLAVLIAAYLIGRARKKKIIVIDEEDMKREYLIGRARKKKTDPDISRDR